MAKKRSSLKSRAMPRSLSASLAGIRAGSALAVDGALQKALGRDPMAADSDFARREARRFVQELGKLKGTYIKIGQMLALFGEQFLPRVLVEALRDLSDQTEPLHWDALESFVRASMAESYKDLEIDPEAAAAASLAQVHLARERERGQWLCLKVQYPGLAQVIDADFDAVVRMLVVARWIKASSEVDAWLESMRAHLHQEIDYLREASMTQQMASRVQGLHSEFVKFHVPELYSQYCTNSVLAMEFIEGYSVTDADVQHLSLERRNALAQGILELFFYELYEWGVMQTDPNFGNYLIRLEDRRKRIAKDEIALLDFGAVLECDDKFLFHLRSTIDAGQRQNIDDMVAGLQGLGCLSAKTSDEGKQLFAEFCLLLLEPLRSPENLPQDYLNEDGQYCWGQSHLIRRAGKLAARSAATRHFETPSRDFALIARKLSGVYNFIAVLDAQFNAHSLLQTHIDRWREKSQGLGKK